MIWLISNASDRLRVLYSLSSSSVAACFNFLPCLSIGAAFFQLPFCICDEIIQAIEISTDLTDFRS
jgi:hypothetical protein